MLWPSGTFIISIDYEYAWGYADMVLSESNLVRIRREAMITERLLVLFEKYHIPATWAIVGRLLESRDDHGADSAWFDEAGLIKQIASSSVQHEIASHSYSHIVYNDSTASDVERDIKDAVRIHAVHNYPHETFVFPRNHEAHHDLLKKNGFRTFRGSTPTWYRWLPRKLWPLARGIDYWLPIGRTVSPGRHSSGLVNIPDSLLLVSRKGIQKLLPPSQAVRKLVWGMKTAVRHGEIFHLWFHPSNFSYDTDTQFMIFEKALGYAAELRAQGLITIVTMDDCARTYAKL